MLTDTIPRLVRGRIYRYERYQSTDNTKSDLWDTLIGVFVGMKNKYPKIYNFKMLAYELCAWKVMPKNLWYSSYVTRLFVASNHTITEVSPDDMLLYVNYRRQSDLYKELLADPDALSKLNLKKKVSRILLKT